ncbi:MAG: TraB/GumN family protein [Candidatus Adiutrix sp.]|jgi:uncharacterized protein YbaP (TraB family)|nr:TraB/GumN family protein [Candidatus Adiutrix sp.]
MQRRARNVLTAWFLAVVLALVWAAGAAGQGWAEELFLWRLTSPAGKRAYLAGSLHLAGPGLYPLPEPFARAFDEAGSLVVEIDTGTLPQKTVSDFIAARGLAAADRALEDYLTPATSGLLAQSGRNRPEYARYRPWLAALAIQMAALEENGFSARYGLDKHFLDQAAGRRLPVVELETFAEQMDILADLGPDEANLFLQATLREAAGLPGIMADFLSAWRRGDVSGLAELLFDGFKGYPELAGLRDRLIIRRNHLMLKRLRPLLTASGPPPFVVVGAGHLVGEESLLALLAAQDYQIEQLRQP